MKNFGAFAKIFGIVIVLGVVALALNNMFGSIVEFAHEEKMPFADLTWYKYDVAGYLANIKNSFQNVAELELHKPTRTWLEASGNIIFNGDDYWNAIINNLALLLDWVLFGINVIIYPIRICFYIMQVVMSLIGMNILPGQFNANPLKWLIDLTYFMKSLEIGYV